MFDSMGVTMVSVGPVHMAMHDRFMGVQMIVLARRSPIHVLVPVVFVVVVRVGVGNPFMLVRPSP